MPQTTTLIALFASHSKAQAALDRLIALGLPAQPLDLTVRPDDKDDTDTRPAFDRLAAFLFPDPDQDLLARWLQAGSVLVTAPTVPLPREPAAIMALKDAGAI